MFKFKESPPRAKASHYEGEARENNLKNIIEELAHRFKKEGVPITNDCRIDMEGFIGVYGEKKIAKDIECVNTWEEEWRSTKDYNEKLKRTGEKFEALKTVILNKFLGEGFMAVRTSAYDDIKNKADNIIINKDNGNVVCAFDEVGDISGERYQRKQEDIRRRNFCPQELDKSKGVYVRSSGGVSLEYGLKVEKDENGRNKLGLGRVEEIPIFLLALSEKMIEEGIKKLTPLNEKSKFEKDLFAYFIVSLEAQVKSLRLIESQLSKIMKERIMQFETSVKNIREYNKI